MIETGVERVPVEEQVDSLEGGVTVEQLWAAAAVEDAVSADLLGTVASREASS